MKRSCILSILAVLSITTGALAIPASGNPVRGEYIYKKTCKECHTAGDIGGKISPSSKTIAEWTSFIDDKKHPKGEFAALETKDFNDIREFIIQHAADSGNPKICY